MVCRKKKQKKTKKKQKKTKKNKKKQKKSFFFFPVSCLWFLFFYCIRFCYYLLSLWTGFLTSICLLLTLTTICFCVFCFIVCVHDESGDNLVLLRSVGSLHIRAIECCAFSEELNQIATGSTNGSLHMIDYDRLRLKSNNVQHQGNMTSIEFIQPNQKNEMKPIVISADTNGIICIW